jgi:hypothetical protein
VELQRGSNHVQHEQPWVRVLLRPLYTDRVVYRLPARCPMRILRLHKLGNSKYVCCIWYREILIWFMHIRCQRGEVGWQRAAAERVPRQRGAPPLVHLITVRLVDFFIQFERNWGMYQRPRIVKLREAKIASLFKVHFWSFDTLFMRWHAINESTVLSHISTHNLHQIRYY